MDMSKHNQNALDAEDNPTPSPKFPSGTYLMAVTEHKDTQKHPVPGSNPQVFEQEGLWVTFQIMGEQYGGKKQGHYFGLSHPTSDAHVRRGLSDLKKFYKAINYIPTNFAEVYGKLVLVEIEVDFKEGWETEDFPFDYKFVGYHKAPAPQGQTFDQSAGQQPATTPPADTPAQGQQPNGTGQGWNNQQAIDEIPF